MESTPPLLSPPAGQGAPSAGNIVSNLQGLWRQHLGPAGSHPGYRGGGLICLLGGVVFAVDDHLPHLLKFSRGVFFFFSLHTLLFFTSNGCQGSPSDRSCQGTHFPGGGGRFRIPALFMGWDPLCLSAGRTRVPPLTRPGVDPQMVLSATAAVAPAPPPLRSPSHPCGYRGGGESGGGGRTGGTLR